MNWDYIQPVEIHFGKGRVNEIKNIASSLGCKKGILGWQVRSSLKADLQRR